MVYPSHPLTKRANKTLIAASRSDETADLASVYENLKATTSFVPDTGTFMVLLNSLATHGRLEDAEMYWKEMAAYHLAPSNALFNVMIKAAARARDSKAIARWLQLMKLKSQPDSTTYITILNFFAHEGKLDEAERYLADMLAQGVTPTTRTYNIILKAATKAGKLQAARSYFDKMKQGELPGVAPDIFSYNTILHAMASHVDPASTKAFLEQMPTDVRPDVISMSAMVKAFSRVGDMDAALRMLEEMKKNQATTPNESTYAIIVEAMMERQMFEQAERVFQELVSRVVLQTSIPFFHMLRGFAAAKMWDKFDEYLTRLREGHLHLQANLEAVNGALALVAAAGKVAQADALCDYLIATQTPPDVVTCNALLKTYLLGGKPENAASLLQLATVKQLDHLSYLYILAGLRRAGMHTKATELLEELPGRGVSDPIVQLLCELVNMKLV